MAGTSLHGTLFVYSPQRRLVAFSTDVTSPDVVVLIGGLGDGLLFSDTVALLAGELQRHGIALVQPLLRSSGSGWGICSLDTDVEDLDELVAHLHGAGSRRIMLVGHSTGCQDAVHYLLVGKHVSLVCGVVLQAPVSDREYFATLADTETRLQQARQLVDAGRSHDVLLRADSHDVPITASRWLSLAGRDGEDDLFSADFTDEQLDEKLGHVKKVPSVVVQSTADEYIPSNIDARAVAHRLAGAMGAKVCLLEGAKHVPVGEHAAAFARIMCETALLARTS
jgi:pimeloyl-ACP methyl ester carboxylesterase